MFRTPEATNHRESELLTVTEAAALLKLSKASVYRLAAEGAIPSLKVGGSIRLNRDELLDSLTRHPIRVEETE